MRHGKTRIVAFFTVFFLSISFSEAYSQTDVNKEGESIVPDKLDKPITAETGDKAKEISKESEETKDSKGYQGFKDEEFPKQSFLWVMLRLVASMVVIVGLIYGTVYVLRHFAKRGMEKPSNERLVQVIDRVALDAKRSVYLIKVIDRLIVVGVGGETVSMLGEIRDENVVESVKSTDFSFHLGNIFSRFQSK